MLQYLDKSEPFLQRKKIRRPYSTPIPGSRATMTSPSAVDPDAVISHTLKLQDWLNEKSIKNIQVNICYNKVLYRKYIVCFKTTC